MGCYGDGSEHLIHESRCNMPEGAAFQSSFNPDV